MNDSVRFMILLGGGLLGTAYGFLSSGGKDAPVTPSRVSGQTALSTAAGPGTKRSSPFAAKPGERLVNILDSFAARAEAAGPGQTGTLIRDFLNTAGYKQLPLIIDILAQRDPRDCHKVLLELQNENRCNSLYWRALFGRWLISEPDAALEALMDLPDYRMRYDAGMAVLHHLAEKEPEFFTNLIKEKSTGLREAGIPAPDWNNPLARMPKEIRKLRQPYERLKSPAMNNLTWGSKEARQLAETAPSGTLTPMDFRHALGDTKEDPDGLLWLAGRRDLAAREALLEQASRYWDRQELWAEPGLRDAAIRRIAVERAGRRDFGNPLDGWVGTLTAEERDIATEALRMDTTLSPENRDAALRTAGSGQK